MQDYNNILLLGAGGHCLSVIESIRKLNIYNKIAVVDGSVSYNPSESRSILGIPIIGSDYDLERLYSEGYQNAFISIGSLGDTTLRRQLYEHIKLIGFQVPSIIDKSCSLSQNLSIGEGVYIGKNAIINSCVTIGNMAIINTAALVEHECHIGDFVHLAPGSILCGNVHIGDRSHIGAGSVVKQGVRVGSDTMIGMGSVVLHNIGSQMTAYGNPCKEKKRE